MRQDHFARTMKTISVPLIVLLLHSMNSFGQHRDWTVRYKGGRDLTGVSFATLRGDSLEVDQSGQAQRVELASLIEIRRREGNSRIAEGAVLGAMIGGIVGYLLGQELDQKTAASAPDSKTYGIAFGIGGSAVGGFTLGSIYAHVGLRSYDMRRESVNEKLLCLNRS